MYQNKRPNTENPGNPDTNAPNGQNPGASRIYGCALSESPADASGNDNAAGTVTFPLQVFDRDLPSAGTSALCTVSIPLHDIYP